mmetsp:Transcript_55193/g.129159  ORF Transcript_55193/g.129159 Transcript_55193/m.129159 type:complete len:316 (-) Transcript_55193:452-1399(-)
MASRAPKTRSALSSLHPCSELWICTPARSSSSSTSMPVRGGAPRTGAQRPPCSLCSSSNSRLTSVLAYTALRNRRCAAFTRISRRGTAEDGRSAEDLRVAEARVLRTVRQEMWEDARIWAAGFSLALTAAKSSTDSTCPSSPSSSLPSTPSSSALSSQSPQFRTILRGWATVSCSSPRRARPSLGLELTSMRSSRTQHGRTTLNFSISPSVRFTHPFTLELAPCAISSIAHSGLTPSISACCHRSASCCFTNALLCCCRLMHSSPSTLYAELKSCLRPSLRACLSSPGRCGGAVSTGVWRMVRRMAGTLKLCSAF